MSDVYKDISRVFDSSNKESPMKITMKTKDAKLFEEKEARRLYNRWQNAIFKKEDVALAEKEFSLLKKYVNESQDNERSGGPGRDFWMKSMSNFEDDMDRFKRNPPKAFDPSRWSAAQFDKLLRKALQSRNKADAEKFMESAFKYKNDHWDEIRNNERFQINKAIGDMEEKISKKFKQRR